MNCWEVLGISPTEDQHQIKKAYAHTATIHHPEDDPDGFQMVYRAFKQAMAFAKASAKTPADFSLNRSSVTPSSKEQVSQQAAEKSAEPDAEKSVAPDAEEGSPKRPGFDTDLLHDAASKLAEEEKQAPGKSEAGAETDSHGKEYDYEDVINRGEAAENEKIKAILETMNLNYQKRKTLQSTKMWKQCFSSAEFLSLRSNEEFTRQFLTYQMNHIDIKPFDWVRVFAPMLREWLYYWPVGELSEKFHLLLRQRNKYGFITKPQARKTAKTRFAYLFICILIIWGAIGSILVHNNANSKNPSSRFSISVPIYQLSPNNELDYLLDIDDVIVGAENHMDYSRLQKECEDLGVSHEKYEQMQKEYAAGDKKSFNRDRDEIIERNSKSRSNSSGEASAANKPVTEKQESD